MRKIGFLKVRDAVREAWAGISTKLPDDVLRKLESAAGEETSPSAAKILERIIANARMAGEENIPICQDTGFPVVFVNQGQGAAVEGGSLAGAIESGIAMGSSEALLRASVVEHPFERKNTGDNTPPVTHFSLSEGDGLRILVAAKGAGSENMSFFGMLKPGGGRNAVKELVLDHVKRAAPFACPPLVVGVGIGGTAEKAMLLAKEACLENLEAGNSSMPDFEEEILAGINSTGIGPAGLGGRTTALAVKIRTFACHIASLPVAININCHALRRRELLL